MRGTGDSENWILLPYEVRCAKEIGEVEKEFG